MSAGLSDSDRTAPGTSEKSSISTSVVLTDTVLLIKSAKAAVLDCKPRVCRDAGDGT